MFTVIMYMGICFMLMVTHSYSDNREDFAMVQTTNTMTEEHQKRMLLTTEAYMQPCVTSIPGCTMCAGVSNCCVAPTTSSNYGYCKTFNKYNCPDGTKAPCDQGSCPGNRYMTCNYVTSSTNTTNAWGSISCTNTLCAAYSGNFCYRAGAQVNPSDFLVCNMFYNGETSAPTTVPTPLPTTLAPTTFKPTAKPSATPTPKPTQFMPNMIPTQTPVGFTCSAGYYVAIATIDVCQGCLAGDKRIQYTSLNIPSSSHPLNTSSFVRHTPFTYMTRSFYRDVHQQPRDDKMFILSRWIHFSGTGIYLHSLSRGLIFVVYYRVYIMCRW